MIGQTLSHYEVLETIGEGGMGVVYKARDTLLGRLVALKTLPSGGPAAPERPARLLREARAASSLHHPNIVDVYDLLQHDGRDVIVMELVTGRTLDGAVAGKPLHLRHPGGAGPRRSRAVGGDGELAQPSEQESGERRKQAEALLQS